MKHTTPDLESEVAAAWIALRRMPDNRRRTLFLTPRRHVVWYEHRTLSPLRIELGTYSNEVAIEDLRADVLWANEELTRNAKAQMKDD